MKNIEFPEFVIHLIKTFQKSGFEIYIVGGAVRDILTKRKVNDWDFTTNAKPDQILTLFPEGFYDNKFGTVGIAHTSSKKPYEITTFRKEIGYSDKRHPDRIVWGKSLEEDLARRDFTINAMALRIKDFENPNNSTDLIDPFGGQKDLKDKIIRAVGNPIKRFEEDALRMIRAIRIASEIGFVIEQQTFEAIKQHAESINTIAKERIRDEIFKILASKYPYEGFVLLRNSLLLKQIIPELEEAFGIEQKSPKRHHIYDVGTHLFLSLKYCPSKDPLTRFAALLHDIGKPRTQKITSDGVITFYNHEIIGSKMAAEIADRLRLSRKERDKLCTLVRWHQFTLNEYQTDSAIRRFIRNVGKENIEEMLSLRIGDRLGGGASETSWRLEKFKERIKEVQKQPFQPKDLKIDGFDVMKIFKINSGPKVGEILNQIFEEVLQKKIKNNRRELLERLKEIASV